MMEIRRISETDRPWAIVSGMGYFHAFENGAVKWTRRQAAAFRYSTKVVAEQVLKHIRLVRASARKRQRKAAK